MHHSSSAAADELVGGKSRFYWDNRPKVRWGSRDLKVEQKRRVEYMDPYVTKRECMVILRGIIR